MITLAGFVSWLDAQVAASVTMSSPTPEEDMPDMPDTVAVISRLGGPGLRMEGAYDSFEFQVKVRGEQGDYTSAEVLAFEIDRVLLTSSMPTIDSTPALAFYRVGSPPTPLQVQDDASRTTFVCNYGIQVGSDL